LKVFIINFFKKAGIKKVVGDFCKCKKSWGVFELIIKKEILLDLTWE
jgi:hypothetical protein